MRLAMLLCYAFDLKKKKTKQKGRKLKNWQHIQLAINLRHSYIPFKGGDLKLYVLAQFTPLMRDRSTINLFLPGNTVCLHTSILSGHS